MLKFRVIIAVVAIAGVSLSLNGRSPEDKDRGRFRHGGPQGSGFFRDRHTSGPGEMYRAFFQNELKNVPLLQQHLGALWQIQQKRLELQRERDQVADNRTLRPEVALRRFHDLLGREDKLNEQQKELFGQVIRDAGRIQQQITARRQQIEQQLGSSQVPDTGEGKAPSPEQIERKNLRRALRMYDFFQGRIEEVRKNPERIDLLNRFLRNVPPADEMAEGRMVDHARRRLEEIQREQQELEARLDHLQNEVRELRQMLRLRSERRDGPQRGQDERTTGTLRTKRPD